MPVLEAPDSKLFAKPFSAAAKLEKHWSGCWSAHEELLQQGDTSRLVELLNKGTDTFGQHGEVTIALVYGSLTVSGELQKRCRDYLTNHTRDKHQLCIDLLRKFVSAHYPVTRAPVRTALLTLVADLISLDAQGADGLCLALVRQVAIGDMSEANLWLASALLHTLRSNLQWAVSSAALLQAALYKYLRLLPDCARGGRNTEHALAQNGAALCVSLLGEHWQVCAGIGRDLARALQDVACLPEFKPLWQNLAAGRPPGSGGGSSDRANLPEDALAELLATPSPPALLQSALTQDMEKEMMFMMTHVRMGNQRRYQQWFQARFLQSPESESVLPDIVRFICGFFHPSNSMIASDVTPRWAVLGWLLQCPRTPSIAANVKLALFYDALFFDPQRDSIMNIEPAMLLMTRSIPKYVGITSMLMEFLIIAKDNYNLPRRHLTQRGFQNAMLALVRNRVVRSLDELTKAEEVPQKLRELFAKHTSSGASESGGSSGKRPPSGTIPSPSAKRVAVSVSRTPSDTGIAQVPSSQEAIRASDVRQASPQEMAEPHPAAETGQKGSTTPEDGGDASPSPQDNEGGQAATSREPPAAADAGGGADVGLEAPNDLSEDRQENDVQWEPQPVATKRAALHLTEEVADMVEELQEGNGHVGDTDLSALLLGLIRALESDLEASSHSSKIKAQQLAVSIAVRAVDEAASYYREAGLAIFEELGPAEDPPARPVIAFGTALFHSSALTLSGDGQAGGVSAALRLLSALRREAKELPDLGARLLVYGLGVPGQSAVATSAFPSLGTSAENGSPSLSCAARSKLYAAHAADFVPGAPSELLTADLRVLLSHSLTAVAPLIPSMLRVDSAIAPLSFGNAGAAEVIAAILLPAQISGVCAALATGQLRLCFDSKSDLGGCLAIATRSRQWDEHSQGVLWKLIAAEMRAHDVQLAEAFVFSLLDSLKAEGQDDNTAELEPVSPGLLDVLRQLQPSKRLVNCLMDLPVVHADVAAAALSTWAAHGWRHPTAEDHGWLTAVAASASSTCLGNLSRLRASKDMRVRGFWQVELIASAEENEDKECNHTGRAEELKREQSKVSETASSTTSPDDSTGPTSYSSSSDAGEGPPPDEVESPVRLGGEGSTDESSE